jgi:uncharacterized integral membrane protein
MTDKHIPVLPNINNHSRESSLFANSKDADIQQFINKKQSNALLFDSPPTKEELVSKGIRETRTREKERSKQSSDNANANANNRSDTDDGPKNEGGSWVIITLAIIIIILIIIIVYYVINYNKLTLPVKLVPASVVKPSSFNAATLSEIQPEISNVAPSIMNTLPVFPKPILSSKPRNFIDPTKNDLNSVLSRLNTIKEQDDKEDGEIFTVEDSHKDQDQDQGSQDDIITPQEKAEEPKIDIKNPDDLTDEIKSMIMNNYSDDEDNFDPEMIDNFENDAFEQE